MNSSCAKYNKTSAQPISNSLAYNNSTNSSMPCQCSDNVKSSNFDAKVISDRAETNNMTTVKTKPKTRSEDIVEQNAFIPSNQNSDYVPNFGKSVSDNSNVDQSTKDSLGSNEVKPQCQKRKKKSLIDYIELDTIGSGAFGKVIKVQCRKTDHKYAMKVIDKNKVERENRIYQVYNECDLLSKLSHKGIINFITSFHDRKNVYMILELAGRGDLGNLMNKLDRQYLSRDIIQFVVAEV